MNRLVPRGFPLSFLALLAVLGWVLEIAYYDTLLWQTKVPVLALLGLAWVRGRLRAPLRKP